MYKGTENVLGFLSMRELPVKLETIANGTGLSLDSIRRIVEWLKVNGYVTLEEKTAQEKIAITEEYNAYYIGGMMPECSVFQKARKNQSVADLNKEEKQFGLMWAKKKGYVDIKDGRLVPLKDEKDVEKENRRMRNISQEIKETGNCPDQKTYEELIQRKLIEKRSQKEIEVYYTGKKLEYKEDFDLSVKSEDAQLGKEHPLSKLENRIKSIFLSMGFEEMKGGIVESAFWNFDALFQPQDHPARELADTFYVSGKAELPDNELVKRVKKAHEEGWKYAWKEEEAEKLVLRTHTTALSARALTKIKKGDAKKYFAIGKVFRNEATDYKHLAEFYQIEGIVVWEKTTFTDLLGILKEFYKSLGFEKIRFRPSYFPYTEPSLEIEVFFEPKQQWMELGGAGIFRPEVSIPLANTYPVLAWGLSLERPLMMLLDIQDIRTAYKNEMGFLKNARL